MKNYLFGIKLILILMIAYAFIALENVIGVRLHKLILLFFCVFISNIIRLYMKNPRKLYFVLLDLMLLIYISQLSRFVVNYYVYAMYVLILIEVGLVYSFKRSKYVMFLTLAISGYHYIDLYRFSPNLGVLSEIIFMLLINVLLIFSLYMFQVATKEREKQQLLNQKLLETNERLEQLTRLEVKTHIARDIHDTFGHDMMALIMEIEMADVLVKKSPDEAKVMLNSAKQSARKGMKTIRKVVETLRTDEGDIITETLDEMIQTFIERTHVSVHQTIHQEIYDLPKKVHDVLYRIVQECMTNSIRHGQATEIGIYIAKKQNQINFRIKDNGRGSENIQLGYGLTGMKERLVSMKGDVRFKNMEGFEVKGYLEVSDD